MAPRANWKGYLRLSLVSDTKKATAPSRPKGRDAGIVGAHGKL
jgi:hypothetical protein